MLTANTGEVAACIDCISARGDGVDNAICIWIPWCCGSGGGVERRDVVSQLPANALEVSSRVHRSVAHSQGIDRVPIRHVWIPGRREPGSGIKLRDVVSHLPANVVEF